MRRRLSPTGGGLRTPRPQQLLLVGREAPVGHEGAARRVRAAARVVVRSARRRMDGRGVRSRTAGSRVGHSAATAHLPCLKLKCSRRPRAPAKKLPQAVQCSSPAACWRHMCTRVVSTRQPSRRARASAIVCRASSLRADRIASASSAGLLYTRSRMRPYSLVVTRATRAPPRCSASSRRHSTLGARHTRSPAEAAASLVTTALFGASHSADRWLAGTTSREAATSSDWTRPQRAASAASHGTSSCGSGNLLPKEQPVEAKL